MFRRVTEWMEEPFTTGAYFKITLIFTAIATAISVIYMVMLFWDEILEKLSKPFKALKDFFTVRVIVHRDEAE